MPCKLAHDTCSVVETTQFLGTIGIRGMLFTYMSYSYTARFPQIIFNFLVTAYIQKCICIASSLIAPDKWECKGYPRSNVLSLRVSDFENLKIAKHRIAYHEILLGIARFAVKCQCT